MAKLHSLAAIVAIVLTIACGIVFVINASIVLRDIEFLHRTWRTLYGLSVFSIVIGILAIIISIALLVVIVLRRSESITFLSATILVVLVLAAVCLLFLAVGLAVLKENVFTKTSRMLEDYNDPHPYWNSTIAFTKIQQKLHCCGFKAATDWKKGTPNATNVPDTCCRTVTPRCGIGALLKPDTIYLNGCATVVYSYLYKRFLIITINDSILILAIVATATLGFVYQRHIRKEYQAM